MFHDICIEEYLHRRAASGWAQIAPRCPLSPLKDCDANLLTKDSPGLSCAIWESFAYSRHSIGNTKIPTKPGAGLQTRHPNTLCNTYLYFLFFRGRRKNKKRKYYYYNMN